MTAAIHSLPEAPGLSGIDIVRGLAAGRLTPPPMREVMPFTLHEPEPGRVTLTALPEARFMNLTGTVHGGWGMTLLDTVMFLAALTTLPPGAVCPTLETTAKFVRPITLATGEVRVIGTVLAGGRTVITLDGRIEDAEGRLLAHGTSSCMVQRRAA